MGVLESLKRLVGGAPMRDRYRDREAGEDPKFHSPTASGNVGPSGSTIEASHGQGGAMEPDPPVDRG